MSIDGNTHSKTIGYILWIFGFMGAHRFYYGRPVFRHNLLLYPRIIFYRMDCRFVPDTGNG